MSDTMTLEREQTAQTATHGTGTLTIGGTNYRQDSKGNLVPEGNIRSEDLLQDQTVRSIMAFALSLNAQIERFRDHTMFDLGAFDALLAEKFGAKIGGAKGNRTYQTFDGLMKIQVQVSDLTDFGPELQAARSLVEECIRDWSTDAREELQTLIGGAFQTDKEGQISKSRLFMLFNREIKDERWKRAMDAVRQSIRVTGLTVGRQ